MNKSKLSEIIYALSVPERNQLEKFIHSAYHNQHSGVIALFEYLRQTDPKDTAALEKPKVFAAVFGNETYNDLKLRHVSSYLQKVVEDFLVWNELEKNAGQKDIYLLESYRSRKINDAFEKEWNSTSKKMMQTAEFPLSYHYHKYKLYLEKYNNTRGRNLELQDVLQNINDELDAFYIINKLKHACNILSHQRIFKTTYQVPLIDEIIRHIEEKELFRIPDIDIYYNAYMILTLGEEKHYRRMKELILQNHHLLPEYEMRDVYLIAINFCIRQINNGNMPYTREVFELYKAGINNRLLFENGELSPWTFKNIVAAGLKLNETQWTHEFIETCYKYMPRQFQKTFYTYNKAKVSFANKDYRNVTRSLHNIEISDLFTNIDAKVLVIKAYYHLSEYELLDYLLDNLSQLLRRKKMLAYHRTNYSNFISFVRKLVNLKSYDATRQKKLVKEIEAAPILTEKEWLLENCR